ncbi:hypothetical protein LMG28614_06492 [Paraburkholderia ultramafica]|uniref:Metalloprotease n=1 Tax=Paraburkholderia ultramafica TaxID=1544867 RepID=A0A6S7C1U6_9BURK|nr:protealysin inhibitor emfourin [Paraburkholderia ultramafica]CAB3806892.1 hypothetical protein LMG28614_06492 [Paraburkholderia ultramafica]
MKVRIERRGGLAGIPAAGERDFDELSSEQREALGALQRVSGGMSPAPGADRFHYKVIMTDDGTIQEFDVSEDAMPDELAGIVQTEP